MANDNAKTYFELKYETLIESGKVANEALLETTEAYLAGKPINKKPSTISNHHLFWYSRFLWDISLEVLNSETFVLAMARFFSQNDVSNIILLERITKKSPQAICKAIRRSEIVLKQKSDKWKEIKRLEQCVPGELTELIKVCEQFQVTYKQRTELLIEYQAPFISLSIFELLSYSSLYAFKGFVEATPALDGDLISTDEKFEALKKILEWKFSIEDEASFRLTDVIISKSLKIHLSPVIFPSEESAHLAETLLHNFEQLVQIQVEIDGFLSRCITPFCFNDQIHYSLIGNELELTVHDDARHKAWSFNGKKLDLLDGYWMMRGISEFIESGKATELIGTPLANHERNQIAYTKALGASLQLREVYGIGDTVLTDNGFDVNVFQALLSLELMIAFYMGDYIEVFYKAYEQSGCWRKALGMLAMNGLMAQNNGEMENRFPITWNKWKSKTKAIIGWTVSDNHPKGSIKAAEAIIDFWVLDFKKWSSELKKNNFDHLPELTERPILKIGNYSVQLPWMMAGQKTGVNVINNLRRFANKRPELRSETTRIEEKLGESFSKRDFKVISSYMPTDRDGVNSGEIDLICKSDDTVLVIEVKSTYRRNSAKEAIKYKNNALRKAGIQIKRKTEEVEYLLRTDPEFKYLLGIENIDDCKVIGWIADTCLEFDHEYFNGFLKISIEELHIALADDAAKLVDINKIANEETKGDLASLYSEGFSAGSFVDIIEYSKIWEVIGRDLPVTD